MTISVADLSNMVGQYMLDIIKAKYPNIDISDGGTFKDLFVDPLRDILSPLVAKISDIELKSNLNNDEFISKDDFNDICEGNYLTSRDAGRRATGEVKFKFKSIAENSNLVIQQGIICSTDDELKFQTITKYEYTPTELYSMYNSSTFFYEVPAIMEAISIGSVYNISPNRIKKVDTPFNDKLSSVSNDSDFVDGTDEETNTEYAERVKSFYISRNLGTLPGYKKFINDNFLEVEDIYGAGKDDDFMTRDILENINILGEHTQKHIGGKIDMYIKGSIYQNEVVPLTIKSNNLKLSNFNVSTGTIKVYNILDVAKTAKTYSILSPETSTSQIVLNVDNTQYAYDDTLAVDYTWTNAGTPTANTESYQISKTIFDIICPMSEIVEVRNITQNLIIDISNPTTALNTYILTDKNVGYSGTSREKIQMEIKDNLFNNGDSITVSYIYNRTLNQLEAVTNLEENRIVTTDILYKEAVNKFLNLSFKVRMKSGQELTDLKKGYLTNAIYAYFKNLKMGSSIEESDIISNLYQDKSIKEFLDFVKLPMDSIYVAANVGDALDPAKRDVQPISIAGIEYATLNKISISTF